MKVQITGTGSYIPPKVETAADLSTRTGRSERWILSRSGVAIRHVAEIPLEQMAAEACRAAMGEGGPPDLLINASLSPVQLIPDTSVFVQQALGWDKLGIPSFSIHATCLSFLVALHQSAALLTVGAYKRILVVSAEGGTRCRDFDEPESAVLIGDGAGAATLERTPEGEGSELLAWEMSTWPAGSHLAELRGCGLRRFPTDPGVTAADYGFHMDGPALFRRAYGQVEALLDRLFARAGMRRDEVDLVVPHQASGPAVASLERLGFAPERTMNLVAEYGNCIAASIPMTLSCAVAEGRIKRGDRILLIGTGAGLSVAGALVRW